MYTILHNDTKKIHKIQSIVFCMFVDPPKKGRATLASPDPHFKPKKQVGRR